MAEETGQEKTEAPTQRREEARRQGRVAVSADLNAGVMLFIGVYLLGRQAQPIADVLINRVRLNLLGVSSFDLGPAEAQNLFFALFRTGWDAIGFFLAAMVATIVAVGLVQSGLHVNPELLEVKWEKLNPAEGWGRIFSLQTVIRGLLSLLKVIAVGLAAWWVLRGQVVLIASLSEGALSSAAAQGWAIVVRTALAVAAVLTLIGIIDYVYQRIRLEQSLRMTRQELKEEIKREEGDPQVKARIRKAMRDAAQRRMLREVPKATVVITNPTHFAVALRYEPGQHATPRVVAKGAGFWAERIVAAARNHAVPIVERKPLARALYRTVGLDPDIPPALYYVVAEILAYLHRLRTAA